MKPFSILTFVYLSIVLSFTSTGNTPPLFLLPQEDGVYVYHTRNLPSGHGFNIYRQDGRGSGFTLLNEEPVRGVRRADELRPVLGERYEQALSFFDEETASQLFLAMRARPTESSIASIVYPEVAKALGRLFIDETAPSGTEVSYRIEFVDGMGRPTGQELTGSVVTEPIVPQAPVITNVENRGRRVTMHWTYPMSPPGEIDFVIRFFIFRIDQQTGERQLLTDDVIIRNNAQSEYFISFESPVMNRTEQYIMTAVMFSGHQGPPSPVYEYELLDNIPPSPVQNLEVRIGEEQWVYLSWDQNRESDLAGYHVYRSTDMTADFERLTEGRLLSPSESFFADSTVVGGLTYFYYVTAVDRTGNESEMSDMSMAQVLDLVIPPKPQNFSGEFNDITGGVDLTWEMEEYTDNFESFIIMRRREDDSRPGAFVRVNMENLTDLSYSDSGLDDTGFPEGATFRYILFSSSKAKNYSDTVSAMVEIPLRTPPQPPAGLTAVNDNGHRINLSWNASPSIHTEKYFIYRKTTADANYGLLKEVSASTLFIRDETLEHGTEYVYAIAAVDRAENESDLSEPDTVFFRNFTPPRSVRNIQAAERETGVEIRWERVVAADLAGYVVYRANTPTGRFQPVHEGILLETNFLDTNGDAGKWYRVRAVDTSGNESSAGTPVRPLNQNN